jgi:hypothetical protein
MAQLIEAGGDILRCEIHKLINSVELRKDVLDITRIILLYQFIRRAINVTVVIIEENHFYQLHTTFYPLSPSQD